jgi:hypothetical protein
VQEYEVHSDLVGGKDDLKVVAKVVNRRWPYE